MKTWYCVVMSYDDSVNLVAAIIDAKEAETRPECGFVKDSWVDWVDNIETAKALVEATKRLNTL